MAQVVEHLSSKREALSSNPIPAKKFTNKKKFSTLVYPLR
jgi:hypothetical protein